MIKRILIIIAIIMTTIGFILSFGIIRDIILFILGHPVWILIIAISVVAQLIGHIFRAKRTKLVTDQAASSSVQFQFSALAIGYLFNMLLPLRLGEFIRAILVAKRLSISFLYTFVAVVIERAVDILFLSLFVIIGALFIGGELTIGLIVVAAITAIFAFMILAMLFLLERENKYLLSLISLLSRLFNTTINNSIRFKFWSLIFGLQSFLSNRKLIKQYVLYAAVSWICYFVSTFIIVIPLLSLSNMSQIIVAGVSPYIISVPSLHAIDPSSYYQLATLMPFSVSSVNLYLCAKIIWAILGLPMAFIGLISLFMYKVTNKNTIKNHPDPYTNKLLRYDDISQKFPIFLDTYFKGHNLSRILHKIEVHGGLSLVKFFKGGSDAITVLALKDGELFVKKIVPVEYTDRLKVQYKWLKKFSNKKAIVQVLSEQKTEDYYAIDLAYDPSNISLFEYMHTNSLKQSKIAIDEVWRYVFKNIYSLKDEALHTAERDEYVQDRLINKVKKAVSVNDDLKSVIDEKQIRINGEVYDNLYTILAKIKKHSQAWTDIATYRASTVAHGDLTIDNILINVKTKKILIIDPSDDNQIRGPIMDFGRQTQSLSVGYEFLNDDEGPTNLSQEDGYATINYRDNRSARYMQIYDYFKDVIAVKYLTDAERRSMLFHAGLLYERMLAHRVVINPGNTLKYYAVGIVLLNKFYDQYKDAKN